MDDLTPGPSKIQGVAGRRDRRLPLAQLARRRGDEVGGSLGLGRNLPRSLRPLARDPQGWHCLQIHQPKKLNDDFSILPHILEL